MRKRLTACAACVVGAWMLAGVAVADDAGSLAEAFKAAAPAERVTLAESLASDHDTPEMVQALVPFLKSGNAELRADVAYALDGFTAPALVAAAPALMHALATDSSWRVQANAAMVLMRVPKASGVVAAFETCIVGTAAFAVRARCAKGLGLSAKAAGSTDAKVTATLTKALQDPHRLVRYGAAEGFAALASDSPSVVQTLAARLAVERDANVLGAMAAALVHAGPAAAPALPALGQAILRPLLPATGTQLVNALAAIGPAAVPTLVAAMGYPGDPATGADVASAATQALIHAPGDLFDPLANSLRQGLPLQRRNALAVLVARPEAADRAAPLFVAAAHDSSAEVRAEAAKGLGRLAADDMQVLPPLLALVSDPAALVREQAVRALDAGFDGGFLTADAVKRAAKANAPRPTAVSVVPPALRAEAAKALGTRLSDADSNVADFAADALKAMGPAAAPALNALQEALLKPGGEVAQDVPEILAAIGTPAVPALIAGVRQGGSSASGNLGARGPAAAALGQLGQARQLDGLRDEAVAALVDGLADSRSDVRAEVASTLHVMGVSPVQSLAKNLQSGTAAQKVAAATSLGALTQQAAAAVPVLAEALDAKEQPVRIAAVNALATLAKTAKPAYPALITALSTHDAKVREVAADALDGAWQLDDAEAMKAAAALADHLVDPDQAVRSASISALANMAQIKKASVLPLLPQLVTAVRNGAPDVHEQAAGTLALFGESGDAALIKLIRKEESASAAQPGPRLDAVEAITNSLLYRGLPPAQLQQAVHALVGALDDPSPDVRDAVVALLGQLGQAKGGQAVRGQVVEGLKRALKHATDDDAKASIESALQSWGVGE